MARKSATITAVHSWRDAAAARDRGVEDYYSVSLVDEDGGEIRCWERKRKSGPSGKNQVQKRAVRIPDEQWERLGELASARGTDRNAVINELVAGYCSIK